MTPPDLAALLNAEEQRAWQACIAQSSLQVRRTRDVLAIGDRAEAVIIVKSGWIQRYRQLRGRRQIVSLYLPGEICDQSVWSGQVATTALTGAVSMPLPLNQAQIGEVVGLTSVHVNRTIASMRDRFGLSARGQRLRGRGRGRACRFRALRRQLSEPPRCRSLRRYGRQGSAPCRARSTANRDRVSSGNGARAGHQTCRRALTPLSTVASAVVYCGQRLCCRAVQYVAVGRKLRAMARAVPADFETVPVHETSRMRTNG